MFGCTYNPFPIRGIMHTPYKLAPNKMFDIPAALTQFFNDELKNSERCILCNEYFKEK